MRTSTIKRVALALGYILMCVGMATGWISRTCGDTHRQLAKLALEESRLSPQDFPDLQRFRQQIIEGSKSEDGHPMGIANVARGDSLGDEWGKVMRAYEAKNFTDAYMHIGIMGHLVQDMAVPAHAFDIQHIKYQHQWQWPEPMGLALLEYGDDLEFYAVDHHAFKPQAVGFEDFGKNPLDAYALMRVNTKDAVNDALAPEPWRGAFPPLQQTNDTSHWNQYWGDKVVTRDHPLVETVKTPLAEFSGTFAFFGDYGPNRFPRGVPLSPSERANREARGDVVPMDLWPFEWYEKYYTPFMNERAEQAIRYSAGCWAAASKALPPLVRPLGDPIVGGLIHVQFTVLENRRRTLTSIIIYVDGSPVVTLQNPRWTSIPTRCNCRGRRTSTWCFRWNRAAPRTRARSMRQMRMATWGPWPSSSTRRRSVSAAQVAAIHRRMANEPGAGKIRRRTGSTLEGCVVVTGASATSAATAGTTAAGEVVRPGAV